MLIIRHLQRGGGYVTPNVCYVEQTKGVVIKPHIKPVFIITACEYPNSNTTNAEIGEYFSKKYPNMYIGTNGEYTPITEDVTISGTRNCDGKVIGIARWTEWSEWTINKFIVFYTINSISKFYSLRVSVDTIDVPIGSTFEYFYD